MAKHNVSRNAVIKRINRKLAHDQERLQVARLFGDGHENTNLGRYYIVDVFRNAVVDHHVDLATKAREIGVLAASEAYAE